MAEEIAHHPMGPSSADKWMTCAGSYQAEMGLPNQISSYAEEGTAAHALAEWTLTDPESNCHDYLGDLIMLGEDGVDYYATQEMCDFTQEYVDYVRDLHNKVGGQIYVEVKVDISHIWPDNFGTSDVVIVAGNTIHVIDLKYGAGITVHAYKNNQALCYAIGAYEEFATQHDEEIDYINVHIVQPRKDHIDTYELNKGDLFKWSRKAHNAYLETQKKNPKRTASPKGCQWCKAKGEGCKEYMSMNFAVIIGDYDDYDDVEEAVQEGELVDPNNVSVDTLVKISTMATTIRECLETTEQLLTVRALAGEKIPGHKVVIGPGRRHWKDEDKAMEDFCTRFDNDVVAPRTLKTPPQLEKLKDSKGRKLKLDKLFDRHVTKTKGNLLLCLESAKGQAVEVVPVEETFSDYEPDDDW